MRIFHILFAILVGILSGVASATPNPKELPNDFVGFTLAADVGTTPHGEHLGFHFGPVFSFVEELTFEVGVGIESELGYEYRFRPSLSLELAYFWNDKLNFVTQVHSVFDLENPEMGLLVGIELQFHKSDVDSASLVFLGGLLIDGQGTALLAVHWSFTTEMFARRFR